MTKKVMFKMLFVVATIFVATSCNKNQKAVNKIEGTWNSAEMTINGVSYGASVTLDFNKCKIKKDDYCNGTWNEAYPSQQGSQSYIFPFEYKTSEDGTKLEIKDGNTLITYDMNLSKKGDELQLTWRVDGDVFYGRFIKQ